jgi:uncharacterized protein YecE (DUF72 family)
MKVIKAKDINIGISGWTYPKWRGVFYPKGLAIKNELFFASRLFHSIEVNGSFYRLQKPDTYRSWYMQAPQDFIFSVKGSRFISHMKKFKDVEIPIANFFASGILELKEKLGPILWQSPPQLKFDSTRMENFIKSLPKNFFEAYELARHHDARAKYFKDIRNKPLINYPLRYAFEVRHDTFRSREFIELLRKYKMCLVFADTGGRYPYFEDITADFIYIRLHGDKEIYTSGYDSETLDWWASKIKRWNRPSLKKAFVYFDNDAKVWAPFNALELGQKLGIPYPPVVLTEIPKLKYFFKGFNFL